MTDTNKRFRELGPLRRSGLWDVNGSNFEYGGVAYTVITGYFHKGRLQLDCPPLLCPAQIDMEYFGRGQSTFEGVMLVGEPLLSTPESHELTKLWLRGYRNEMSLAEFLNATIGDVRG